jgi:hypothetical protein
MVSRLGTPIPAVGTELEVRSPFGEFSISHGWFAASQVRRVTGTGWRVRIGRYYPGTSLVTDFPADAFFAVPNPINSIMPINDFTLHYSTDPGSVVEATAKNILDEAIATGKELIGGIVGGFDKTLKNLIDAAIRLYRDTTAKISEIVEGVIKKVGDTISGWIDAVKGFIDNIVRTVSDFIKPIIDRIDSSIQGLIAGVKEGLQGFLDGLKESFDKVLGQAGGFLDKISTTFDESVKDARDFIKAVTEKVFPAAEEIAKYIKRVIDNPAKWWEEAIVPALIKFFGKAIEASLKELDDRSKENIGYIFNVIDQAMGSEIVINSRDLRVLLAPLSAKGTTPLARVLLSALMIFSYIPAMFAAGRVPLEAGILEETSVNHPWQRLSLTEYAQAERLGIIGEGFYHEIAERLGYRQGDRLIARSLQDQLPNEAELLTAWLREEIDEDTLDESLSAVGASPFRASLLKRLVFYIPPPSDLIYMAVKEAFSPDFISKFRSLEGFPEEFRKWAKRQGISEEWAKRYWAAHWHLPSPAQGFEMLHRGIISKEELDLLLKALDIMPFWRDKLREISYNPLTRVDVRRMHAIGALDRGGVVQAYKDIGYTNENAELLTQFTERLSREKAERDEDKIRDLTASQITRFLGMGLLTKPQAIEMLKEADFDPAAANLLITAAELSRSADEREEIAKTVLARIDAGLLTISQALAEISSLGFDAVEQDLFIAKAHALVRKKVKTPGVQDLLEMFGAGIIDEEVLRGGLFAAGYSDPWIDRYVELAKRETPNA